MTFPTKQTKEMLTASNGASEKEQHIPSVKIQKK